MVGEARTVVRGTDIVTFPVRILDVQRAADGPGGALILARAEGPLMDETGGVAEGMSGSPVYVTGADGVPRVIGAIAFGAGDQANVVVGLTPIEQMIDASAGQRALERAPASRRRAARDPGRRPGRRAAARGAGAPTASRSTRSRAGPSPGASRPLIGPALARARALGHPALVDRRRARVRPAVPLVPGATMTALLGGGDIAIGAIGTVTYVDGDDRAGLRPPVPQRRPGALPAGRRLRVPDDRRADRRRLLQARRAREPARHGDGRPRGRGHRRPSARSRASRPPGRPATTPAGRPAPCAARSRPTRAPRRSSAASCRTSRRSACSTASRAGTLTLRISIASPDLRRPVDYRNVYAAAGDVATLASGRLPRLAGDPDAERRPAGAGVRPHASTSRLAAAGAGRADRGRPRRPAPRAAGRPGHPAARAPALAGGARGSCGSRSASPPASGPGRAALRVVPNTTGGFDPLPADLTQELGTEGGPVARRAAVAAAERGVGAGDRHPPRAHPGRAAPGDRRPPRRRAPARAGRGRRGGRRGPRARRALRDLRRARDGPDRRAPAGASRAPAPASGCVLRQGLASPAASPARGRRGRRRAASRRTP